LKDRFQVTEDTSFMKVMP